MKYVFCSTLLLFAYLPAIAATLTPDVPYPCAIRLSGPIDAKTPAALEAAILKVKTGSCGRETQSMLRKLRELGVSLPTSGIPINRVLLQIENSAGGDLLSAMQAGRIIRREMMHTVVPLKGTCASACVFMYLGGVDRSSLLGSLGLHRPYSIGGSQSLSESQQKINRIMNLVKSYLQEMNIPPRLLDVMNAIPPDQIRWLPESDQDVNLMAELLLDGEDPAFADVRDSELAGIYGLTKQEYYARSARATAACKNVRDTDPLCYSKFMLGKR